MEDISYYDFESFRLSVEDEQLTQNGMQIPLTHKAFRTLLMLVRNSGHLVRKEDIISEIWHDSFVEDANLTQQVYILRKTLGNSSSGRAFIETVPKRGYIFTASVTAAPIRRYVTSDGSFGDEITDDGVLNREVLFDRSDLPSDVGHMPDRTNEAAKEAPSVSRIKPVLILCGVLLLLLGGIFVYRSYFQTDANALRSLAVFPLRSIGEESTNAKIGFGMADAIITQLSKLQKFPVRPSTAVFQYSEQPFDPIAAGKELGVESVLDGTIQREGEMIRVSVRLIKVDDGTTLWAETFDEKFTYIFALQDSISKKVARSLLANLTNAQEQQLTSHSTANAEAFEAYQLGVFFWNKRTKPELEKAVSYFSKAIELDPSYGLAYAMLADAHNMLHYYGFAESPKDTIDSSERAAAKALKIDETIAEAHIAMSYVQLRKTRDAKQAKISLERAIALAPYNPAARIRYGWQLLREGELPQASEQMRLAQENDPLSAVSNSAFCTVLMLRRQNPEALKYCSKAAELQPEMPALKLQLGVSKFLNGLNDEAIQILREASKNERTAFDAKSYLIFIYSKTGRTAEAETEFAGLLADPNAKENLPELALAAFALGKSDQAVGYMNEMIKLGYVQPLSIVSDPLWLTVLEDPRMRQLAEGMDIR